MGVTRLAGSTGRRLEKRSSTERSWLDSVLLVLLFIAVLAALYGAFIYAPTERVQGDVQRIFYFHIALAWLAFLSFFVVLAGSVVYLWRRSEWWDALAVSSAEIGVVFTTLVLITGSLWGKPIWGTWWTWDARLTTTLILWLIYVVYLMLRSYTPDRARAARYSAVLGIIGFIDVPIVYFSVTWWRTLHPGPVVREGGMTSAMLLVMLVSLAAFTLFYVVLLRYRIQIERLQRHVEELRDQIGV